MQILVKPEMCAHAQLRPSLHLISVMLKGGESSITRVLGSTTTGQQEWRSSRPIFQMESSTATRISRKPTNANRASASGRGSPGKEKIGTGLGDNSGDETASLGLSLTFLELALHIGQDADANIVRSDVCCSD